MKIIWEKDDGDIPKSCKNCKFADQYVSTIGGETRKICRFTHKEIAKYRIHYNKNKFYWFYLYGTSFRPDWCPLVMKEGLPNYKFIPGEYDMNSGIIPSVESEEL